MYPPAIVALGLGIYVMVYTELKEIKVRLVVFSIGRSSELELFLGHHFAHVLNHESA